MEKYFSYNKCWPSNSYCARKIFVKVRSCEETIILLFLSLCEILCEV